MMFRKEITYFICLLFVIMGCDSKKQAQPLDVTGKQFNAYWAETSWTYEFKKDGTFSMKSEGHYSFETFTGKYAVLDSLILLNADTDWQVFDGVLKTKLKVMSNGCLRDFSDNFYCTTIDSMNFYTDKKYEFEEKVIALIDSLPEVKKTKAEIMAKYPNTRLDIDYMRIIVVDKVEYHAFELNKRYEDEIDTHQESIFLVKKQPFQIYSHHLAGNKLELVYKQPN